MMEVGCSFRQTRRDRGPFDSQCHVLPRLETARNRRLDLEDLYCEDEGLAGVTEE